MTREMKDSGIEWIGEIPREWEVSSLKHLGQFINGYAFKPEQWGFIGKRIIRIQDLTGSNDNPNYYDGDIDIKYHINNGDILVSWAATLDTFIWNKGEGLLNQHIFKAIHNEKRISYKFFYWLLKETMENMNNDNKHGIVMQHVTLDVFNNFKVPLPNKYEQQQIAVFLDTQCAHIDFVIEKTRAAIEEYKKLKQAVITQAVTKGIRPNREMKDSGTGYIGQIPVKWEVVKLRYLGICQNGISKGGEYFGSGFPFVSYSDVYKNMELPLQVDKLVESTEEEQDRYSVIEGDIFFTRTSETIEEIGFTSVCKQTIEKATFAGFLIRVRPVTQKLLIGFSKYYFRSEIHRQYFVKEMNLVTRASLGQELLKNLPVLVPSITEQSEIVAYLDEKTAAIDSLIQKKEQLITELEDYKKSLIYEYVTGKKEVI